MRFQLNNLGEMFEKIYVLPRYVPAKSLEENVVALCPELDSSE